MATEVDIERVGELADTVDNLIAAEAIPFTAELAKTARIASLTALRDELRGIYTAATGDDPWNDGANDGGQ